MSFRPNAGGGVPAVEVQRAAELQSGEADALIVDVREPNEYTQLRVPGAVLVPLGQLEVRLDELPRDRQLLMLCRSGARSHNATGFLLANGFDRVSNVSGGILAWHAAGLPTESGPPSDAER